MVARVQIHSKSILWKREEQHRTDSALKIVIKEMDQFPQNEVPKEFQCLCQFLQLEDNKLLLNFSKARLVTFVAEHYTIQNN